MENQVVILIDGGFFTQRFKENQKVAHGSSTTSTVSTVSSVATGATTSPTTSLPSVPAAFIPKNPTKKDVEDLIADIMVKVDAKSSKGCTNHLLRTLYYDSLPFSKEILDMSGKLTDYSKSPKYAAIMRYIDSLKTIEQFALRLGELSFSGWKLNPHSPSSPAKPDFRQKGVDMKIGLDMAWIAGKKSVEKIVLVTGDSDFISPIKLARREGILVYLYPMQQTQLKLELKQHCDFIL